jgi:hypothetical protein
MIISAEELAWVLDTHIDFAEAVLHRIRSKQRREPYIPPLPIADMLARINRACEPPREIPAFLRREVGRE